MQRTTNEGIVISCDFCGTDWQQVEPMIEGHHGSVLCLDCFKHAYGSAQPGDEDFHCTLCLRDLPGDTPHWRHPAPDTTRPGINRQAVICEDCIKQAAAAFHKDPDVDWSKR